MRFFYVFIILTIAFHYNYGAVLIATTEDGRKVILKEDNSWKFATPNDITAIKTMQSNSTSTASAQTENQNQGTENARVQMKSQGAEEPERAGFLDVIRGDNSFDIRKALWGMEKPAVKKSENLQ